MKKIYLALRKIIFFFEEKIGLRILLFKNMQFFTRSHPHSRYLRIIKYLFKKKDLVIFEIGAHRGFNIDVFINGLKNYNLEIFGFEPNKECYDFLVNKYSKFKKIDFFNFALGKADEKKILNITNNDNLSSFFNTNENYYKDSEKNNAFKKDLSLNPLKVLRKEEVYIKKGDSVLNNLHVKEVDVLSLNVQGFEIEVLNGLRESLSSGKIKSIIIEVDFSSRYNSSYSLKDVELIASECGFELFDINLIKNFDEVGIYMLDLFYVHNSLSVVR